MKIDDVNWGKAIPAILEAIAGFTTSDVDQESAEAIETVQEEVGDEKYENRR